MPNRIVVLQKFQGGNLEKLGILIQWIYWYAFEKKNVRKFEIDGMHERYRSTCIFSQAGEFASVVHIFRMRTGITGITVVKLCGCTG